MKCGQKWCASFPDLTPKTCCMVLCVLSLLYLLTRHRESRTRLWGVRNATVTSLGVSILGSTDPLNNLRREIRESLNLITEKKNHIFIFTIFYLKFSIIFSHDWKQKNPTKLVPVTLISTEFTGFFLNHRIVVDHLHSLLLWNYHNYWFISGFYFNTLIKKHLLLFYYFDNCISV